VEAKVEGRRENIKMWRGRGKYIFRNEELCNWDWEEDLEGSIKTCFLCLLYLMI
jgi:hypothetical protein